MIPHNKPCTYEEDAKQAYDTVMSGWLAYGEKSTELENKLSKLIYKIDENKSVVCSNGTTALYLALYALDIKKEDEVILSTYTCTAVLNAVIQIGAKPILVDINKNDLNLDYENVKENITPKTKAIIIIHTYGISCEIEKFQEFNIPIIEDCSQSLGSKFKDGTQTGSKGDIAIFSFYATKMATGGYGGAVLSRDNKIISKLKDYIEFDQPDKFYPRFNFLLSDINASVINSQLDKLEFFLQRRKLIATKYKDALLDKYLKYINHNGQNYYRFILSFDTKEEMQQVYKYFLDNNIGVINPLANSELLHSYMNKQKSLYKISEEISYKLLSIPIYPCLDKKEIKHIINKLKELT